MLFLCQRGIITTLRVENATRGDSRGKHALEWHEILDFVDDAVDYKPRIIDEVPMYPRKFFGFRRYPEQGGSFPETRCTNLIECFALFIQEKTIERFGSREIQLHLFASA